MRHAEKLTSASNIGQIRHGLEEAKTEYQINKIEKIVQEKTEKQAPRKVDDHRARGKRRAENPRRQNRQQKTRHRAQKTGAPDGQALRQKFHGSGGDRLGKVGFEFVERLDLEPL